MQDDKLYEQLDAFIKQAQKARECLWEDHKLEADLILDKLILAITNYKTDRILEESEEL